MNDFNNDLNPQKISSNNNTNKSKGLTKSTDSTATSQSSQPAMHTVKDLINTLSRMNQKLEQLENENAKLRQELDKKAEKRDVIQMISKVDTIRIPKTGLFSDNFIVRSISIYGHWFVINLVISIIMGIISFILFASVFNQIATNLMNTGM